MCGAKVACRDGAGLVARVPRAHTPRPRLAARTICSTWPATQAGAQQTAWASGTGEVLKGAAATFAVRAGPSS
eukprot:scaffold47792_cov69-Phaeocystis_antarctica.AAC.4